MNSSKLFQEPELIKEVDKCILMHHTDMFFTYLFRHIIYTEFEEKKITIELSSVKEKYMRLCVSVLKNLCGVDILIGNRTENTYDYFQSNHKKVFEYAQSYEYATSYFINARPSLEQTLSQFTEPTYIRKLFFSACMTKGFEIAQNRIEKYFLSKGLIGHELVTTKENSVLKIFPTPKGFIEKNKIVELIKKNLFEIDVKFYLQEYGFERFGDLQKWISANNSLFFIHPEIEGVYHYKLREQSDEYIPFGEQDRNSPGRAFIMQGQINLTLSKDLR